MTSNSFDSGSVSDSFVVSRVYSNNSAPLSEASGLHCSQKITFVSSLEIKDMKKEEIVENIEYYISNHMHLHLYIFNEYKDIIDSIIEKNPNKIQYEIVDYGFNELKNQVDREHVETIKKSSIINEIEKHSLLELPNHRNHEKDTFSYILNSHVKHELLEKAIISNLFDSTHFAWFDFNIISLFKNKKETGEYLKWINQMKLANTYIAFPGCWPKLEKEKIDDVLNNVHWRFCGGFFIGDIHSMKQFCELYKEKMPEFLNEYKKLVWDFNFWAWLESFHEERWNPKWYRGDHNDSILYSSSDFYTRTLENIHKKTEYSYPRIETYYPTSASYLYFQGKHLLNTRFVNYWIFPTGCYLFNNPNRLIENKNILSELNQDTMEPIDFKEIVENISLPVTKNTISTGLEDVRLYELNGIVKYIATTSGYSPSGKSRMIVGTYDIDKGMIDNGQIIESPNPDSWCEKNWIPIVKNTFEEEEEFFIYKWYPIQIGKGELIVTHTNKVNLPIFNKIKGSTIFYKTEQGLIGVVHYCEDHAPRHYYHMLVILDAETFHLKKYTETFCFEKLGVEYCIGFTIKNNSQGEHKEEYVFWISRHDRDPLMIQINTNNFKWFSHEE